MTTYRMITCNTSNAVYARFLIRKYLPADRIIYLSWHRCISKRLQIHILCSPLHDVCYGVK